MQIIAEAGINHGGKYIMATDMVTAAHKAGADIVKFQTFKGMDELPYPNITYADTSFLVKRCIAIGIEFMSTPHSYSAIDFLEPLVDTYKIASPRLFDKKFLEAVAEKKKPVIISVSDNASNYDVENAIKWLDGCEITFMHTVCQYPAQYPYLFMLDMRKQLFPDYKWGYSDHTTGIQNCIYAVKFHGAELIEKHFMIEKGCVDEPVSVMPDELEELCATVKNA